MRIDHETVLNMWAAGEKIETIAAAVGTLYNTTISSLVSEHRIAGDPRALKRREQGSAFRNQTGMSNIARFHRMNLLKRLPGNIEQIKSAIVSYTGPITHCPPAVHLGYRPKCLDLLENT